MMYYAEPRFTIDIDMWIKPNDSNANKVWNTLTEFGAPLEQVALDDFFNREFIYQFDIATNRYKKYHG